MSSLHTGVTYYEDDRSFGPFKIRIGGTNEFVSIIDPEDTRSWPVGSVETCKGWENIEALMFETMDAALAAADQVWDIEGIHTSVERSF